MKEKYIKKLIRLVEDSKIESLEVSSWGRRVKITQHLPVSPNGNSEQSAVFQQMTQAPQPAQPPQAMSEQIHPPVPSPPAENTSQYVEIKSPMVGTFYAAPAPDADPYVSLNEKISVGQVVCIVEA
ncbi:MAG: acetyl-CoA carboxylase biotin carboxyl carrier protein, partial [Candidatus Zixiibacteriota bacterium]